MKTYVPLLIALLLAVPYVLAEEPAPPTEKPAEAAGETPKADEMPVFENAEAKFKWLKEQEEKQAAEAKLYADPKSIIGKPPAFPLPQDKFDSIEDGIDQATLSDNFNRKTGEMEIDLFPMETVLLALRASTQEHLEANIDASITYEELMRNPEKYRGKVVRLIGKLEYLSEKEIMSNMAGVKKLWRGQLSNGQGNIITFRSLEPMPEDVKKGRAVELVGIFLQRYAYLNQAAGEQIQITPLVFARSLKRYTELSEAVAPASNPMNHPVVIIIFIVLGAAIVFYCANRAKVRSRMSNKFSRLKEEREGPEGNFPSATAARKTFPQPQKKAFPQPETKPPEKA
jgi:hypothetical protein